MEDLRWLEAGAPNEGFVAGLVTKGVVVVIVFDLMPNQGLIEMRFEFIERPRFITEKGV